MNREITIVCRKGFGTRIAIQRLSGKRRYNVTDASAERIDKIVGYGKPEYGTGAWKLAWVHTFSDHVSIKYWEL
jgi:hypothetical protein